MLGSGGGCIGTTETVFATGSISLGTSPVYVTGVDDIESIALGEPDHSGAVEWARTRNQQTWGSGPLLRKAVLREHEGIYLEASGGVTLESVRKIAETGVDGISIGSLTHTLQPVDLSLEITKEK